MYISEATGTTAIDPIVLAVLWRMWRLRQRADPTSGAGAAGDAGANGAGANDATANDAGASGPADGVPTAATNDGTGGRTYAAAAVHATGGPNATARRHV